MFINTTPTLIITKKLEGATNSAGGAVDFMTYLVILAIKLLVL